MIGIPTLTELYNQCLSDLEAAYGESIPVFGKNYLRVKAANQAARLKLYYIIIAKVQKNIFVDTAEPEASGGTLERFGRVKLGRNPFPAKSGEYVLQVQGEIGSVIPASTTFKSNDDSLSPGNLYVLDNQYTLVAETDTITVRALVSGLSAKLMVGDALTATAPIADVNKIAVVTSEAVAPLAAEDIEDYRNKALESYRLEAQGGAAADYRLWSYDAQGVKQTYPFARSGETSVVDVYVEATIADSVDGKGTPAPALLSDVKDVIDYDPDVNKPLTERGRRPLTAVVYCLPVTVREIDIEIADFVGITPALQTLIFNALKAETDRIRPFVPALDVLDTKNDILDVNKIILTILNAKPGSIFGQITLKVDNVAVPSYTFLGGNIPHLNSVNYV